MNRRFHLASVSLVATSALLAGLLGGVVPASAEDQGAPPAAAQEQLPKVDIPEDQDVAPFGDQLNRVIARGKGAEEVIPGQLNDVSMMSITAQQVDPARRGGEGKVDIVLMRRQQDGPAIDGLKVKIEVQPGAHIADVNGDGWKCDVGNGNAETVLCDHPDVVPAGDNPPEMIAIIAIDKDAAELSANDTMIVSVSGTWTGDVDAQDERAGRWLAEGYGDLEVRTPVTLNLESVAGKVTQIFMNAAEEDQRLQLIANLGGIEDGQVAVRWEQVGGPDAEFLNDTYVEHASEEIGQIVQLRNLTAADQTYRFKVTAMSNGQEVSDVVEVKVITEKALGEVDPNLESFQQLADASIDVQQAPQVAFTSINAQYLRIQGKFTNVLPGSTHKLKVLTKKGTIASVEWLANAPDGSTQTISRKAGVSVTAAGTPGAADAIEVIVTTTKGRTYQKAILLTTTAAKAPADRSALAEDDPANKEAICTIYNDLKAKKDAGKDDEEVTIDLGHSSKLVFKVSDVSLDKPLLSFGECNGKYKVKVENAQYTHQSTATFKNVEAEISIDGFTLKQADWEIPSKIRPPGMLDRLLIMRFKGEARAAYNNGNFDLIKGNLTVQPIKIIADKIPVMKLSWLPLPGGWKFKEDSTVLNFLNDSDKTYADPIKDGTLRMGQQAEGPNGGNVSMSIDYAEAKFSVIKVAVANLQLGTTALGDTIAASGEGTFAVNDSSDRNSVRISVGCYRAGVLSSTCTIFTGLDFKEFIVEWKLSGIKLTAKAAVKSGSSAYEFQVAGDYSNANNWGFEVASANAWNLGNGMQLTDLTGRIQRRPRDATKTDSDSILTASLTGTFTGLKFSDGITVEKLTPALTNECAQGDKLCNPKDIRLSVEATISAKIPGAERPTKLVVFAAVNLNTMAFTFQGGVSDIKFGPKELQLTEVRFTLTNDPANMCSPKGTAATGATGPFTLGVQATASVLGQPYTVNANFNSNGVCFWGKRGAFDLANGVKALDGVLAYTSYSQGADIKLADGRTLTLDKANVITIKGSFEVPKSLQDSLKIPAGGMTYTASLATDLSSASFEIAYTPTDKVYLYRNDTSNMTLTQIGIKASFTLKPIQVDLMVYADGNVFIKGANGNPDSNTPVGVSIGVGFGTMGISLKLQAGVNSNNQAIQNAFGQPGLTVRQLAISAVIAVPIANSELSFNADVNLPPSWGNAIGIMNSAPVRIGFRLAKSNPCLIVQIGTEGSNQIAVDVAKAGVITAKYFKVVIAPSGCNLPSGGRGEQWINPGFAFAFDGQIVGSPVTLILEVSLSDGLKIKGQVRLPKIDLYALQLSDYDGTGGPKLDMDIDTKASKYDISIDAAVEVGAVRYGIGAVVRVKGSLKTSDPNYVTISLRGQGRAVVWPVELNIDPLVLNAKFAKSGGDKSQNYANGSAAIGFWLLGQYIYASGSLDYRGDKLIQLRVTLGAYFDIWIAAISGQVAFNYCMGWLDAARADGWGSNCHLYGADSWSRLNPAIRVDASGRYRILWWWNDYLWTVYNRNESWKAKGNREDQDTNDLVISSPVPTGLKAEVTAGFLQRTGGDLQTTNNGVTTVYKTVGTATVNGNEPCKTPTLGAKWEPTKDNPNPKVTALDPMNAANEGACGLQVAVAAMNGKTVGTPTTADAVCTSEGCKVDGKFVAGDGVSATAAKDKLIAGLQALPGVLPAGAALREGATMLSPNGVDRLSVTKGVLSLTKDNKQVWALLPDQAGISKDRQVELAKNGELQLSALVLSNGKWVRKVIGTQGTALKQPAESYANGPVLVLNASAMTVYKTPKVAEDNVLWKVKLR